MIALLVFTIATLEIGFGRKKLLNAKGLLAITLSKLIRLDMYCVDKSRDMSRDHFAKNCKLLTSWLPV